MSFFFRFCFFFYCTELIILRKMRFYSHKLWILFKLIGWNRRKFRTINPRILFSFSKWFQFKPKKNPQKLFNNELRENFFISKHLNSPQMSKLKSWWWLFIWKSYQTNFVLNLFRCSKLLQFKLLGIVGFFNIISIKPSCSLFIPWKLSIFI